MQQKYIRVLLVNNNVNLSIIVDAAVTANLALSHPSFLHHVVICPIIGFD
jgi:hypothetical protein